MSKYSELHKLIEANLEALGIQSFTITDSDMFPGVSISAAVSADNDTLFDVAADRERARDLTNEYQQTNTGLKRDVAALEAQNLALNRAMGELALKLQELKDKVVSIRANAQYFNDRVVADLMTIENSIQT